MDFDDCGWILGASGFLDLVSLGRCTRLAKGVDVGPESWRLEARRRWGDAIELCGDQSWRGLLGALSSELVPRLEAGRIAEVLAELHGRGALPSTSRAVASTLRAAVRQKNGAYARAIALYVTSDGFGRSPSARGEAEAATREETTGEAVGEVIRGYSELMEGGSPEAALRSVLVVLPFLPISTGRGADRLIRAVSEVFAGKSGANGGHAYVLIYALIMLNTDLHNPKIRPKMTEDAFVSSLRRTIIGDSIPEATARGHYRSVLQRPLRCSQEDRARHLAPNEKISFAASLHLIAATILALFLMLFVCPVVRLVRRDT